MYSWYTGIRTYERKQRHETHSVRSGRNGHLCSLAHWLRDSLRRFHHLGYGRRWARQRYKYHLPDQHNRHCRRPSLGLQPTRQRLQPSPTVEHQWRIRRSDHHKGHAGWHLLHPQQRQTASRQNSQLQGYATIWMEETTDPATIGRASRMTDMVPNWACRSSSAQQFLPTTLTPSLSLIHPIFITTLLAGQQISYPQLYDFEARI